MKKMINPDFSTKEKYDTFIKSYDLFRLAEITNASCRKFLQKNQHRKFSKKEYPNIGALLLSDEMIDLHEFAPSYLEHMLDVDLPYLIDIEYEKHSLLSLKLYNKKILKLYCVFMNMIITISLEPVIFPVLVLLQQIIHLNRMRKDSEEYYLKFLLYLKRSINMMQ